MIEIVFVDVRTRRVIDHTYMHGPLDRVRMWAVGYARFLNASFAISAVVIPRSERSEPFAISEVMI